VNRSRWLRRAIAAAAAAALLGLVWLAVLVTRSEQDAAPPGPDPVGQSNPAPAVASLSATPPQTASEVRELVRATRDAPPGAASELRERALTSRDPLVAGNALRALGVLKRVASDPELVALLQDRRLRVQQEVVIALGESDDPSAVDVLAPRLASAEDPLRPLVIQALGQLPGERARALVAAIAEDSSASTTDRAFARAALAR
jgi:HEAT repeat protein